jgi:hypothetical protein
MFIFNFYIRLLLETYLEASICAILTLNNIQTNSIGDYITLVSVILISVLIIAFPIFSTIYIKKKEVDLFLGVGDHRFKELYNEMKIYKNASIIHNLLFTLKRILFAV